MSDKLGISIGDVVEQLVAASDLDQTWIPAAYLKLESLDTNLRRQVNLFELQHELTRRLAQSPARLAKVLGTSALSVSFATLMGVELTSPPINVIVYISKDFPASKIIIANLALGDAWLKMANLLMLPKDRADNFFATGVALVKSKVFEDIPVVVACLPTSKMSR